MDKTPPPPRTSPIAPKIGKKFTPEEFDEIFFIIQCEILLQNSPRLNVFIIYFLPCKFRLPKLLGFHTRNGQENGWIFFMIFFGCHFGQSSRDHPSTQRTCAGRNSTQKQNTSVTLRQKVGKSGVSRCFIDIPLFRVATYVRTSSPWEKNLDIDAECIHAPPPSPVNNRPSWSAGSRPAPNQSSGSAM